MSEIQTTQTIPRAPETPYPPAAIGWRAVAILLVLYIVSLLDRSIMQLMIDPIRHSLKLTDFDISLLIGVAFAGTYALASLPLGYAADRGPRRLIIAIGVGVWGLATIGCGLAMNFIQFFIARLGVGIGEAALVPSAHSIIADYYPPERRTFPLTVFQLGAAVGGGISFGLGGALIAAVAKVRSLPLIGPIEYWQVVFLCVGIPSALAGLLIFLVPEPGRQKSHSQSNGRQSFVEVFSFIGRHRSFFFAHFLGFAMLSSLTFGVVSWTPTYLTRIHGWSMMSAGATLGILALTTGIIGNFGAAALASRWFRAGDPVAHLRCQFIGTCLAALCGTTAFMASDPRLSLGLLGLAMALALMPTSALGAASLQLVAPPHLRGRLAALYLCAVNFIGGGLGPVMVAGLTDFVFHDDKRLGASMAANFAIIAPAAALLIWLGMAPMRAMLGEQAERSRAASSVPLTTVAGI